MRKACLAGALALALSGYVGAQEAAKPASVAVPPVKDRSSDAAQSARIPVRGFRVEGVGSHVAAGITPKTIQQLADERFHALGGSDAQPEQLSFAQMQDVAAAITERYRKAGFIVATAFLPAQDIGGDQLIRIQVLEGKIGKVIVKGNKRYHSSTLSAPVEKLRGEPLQKQQIDSALLYVRDFPGVATTSTFQPGEHTGETDLVMMARETSKSFIFTTGANNYGTPETGRYRAQFGTVWNNPLGYGDSLAANIDYALDPSQNVFGSLLYRAPIGIEPGLSAIVGGTHSELRINTGPFTALDVKGPTTTYFAGLAWKYINSDTLSMQWTATFMHEESRLNSQDMALSDEAFNVGELGYSINHTDQRFHGVDLMQVSMRHSFDDESAPQDLVSPNHDAHFTVAKFSYTRLQFLAQTQRLYFKLGGQYTSDALPPLEQFAIGGPDSVRAYPIADALVDRGFYTSLEYHIDAPGFSNVASPFHGRPWRELLEVETFVDYARGYPAGANRTGFARAVTFSGIGAGFVFRLPTFHHFEFHLDGSVPLSDRTASDDHGYHVYARFGFTF